MKDNTSIRALAFDIGQVIVRVNAARTLQALAGGSGKTPEEVRHVIAADGRLRDFQEGRLTPQEWHAHLARQAGLRLSFEAFREAWNASLDRETILPTELFERLGANHRLAVVSNTDPLHVDYMTREFTFLRHFPSRVYSCEVGASKPAQEIYERVLSVLETTPQNTLYIDDVPEYVEAARRAGMHAHRFENAESLLADLRSRNLL